MNEKIYETNYDGFILRFKKRDDKCSKKWIIRNKKDSEICILLNITEEDSKKYPDLVYGDCSPIVFNSKEEALNFIEKSNISYKEDTYPYLEDTSCFYCDHFYEFVELKDKQYYLQIQIKCKNSAQATNIGNELNYKLAGIKEYIGNENGECGIVLNVTDDIITLIIGDECSNEAKIAVLGWPIFRSAYHNL